VETNEAKVVSFRCDAAFADALTEYATLERCSVAVAAHDIIRRELQLLDYLITPPKPSLDLSDDDDLGD
jgi:hypothetical protein